jgi:hypothetical protein
MATFSSTSLKDSKLPLNRRNESIIYSSSPLFSNPKENIESIKSKQQQIAKDNQSTRSNENDILVNAVKREKIDHELVEKPRSKSRVSPESFSSSSSVSSLNISTSSTSKLLSYLQYGDVFIRLNPLI